MSFHVIGLANAVVDVGFQIDHFPIVPSEHQFTQKRFITPGGMANTLICGARLGLKMQALGNIGNDDFAPIWRRLMEAEGIDISEVVVYADRPTSVAVTLVDGAGEHLFLVSRGDMPVPNGRFPQPWRSSIAQADALIVYGWNYLSLGAESNLIAIETARAASIPVFFDPGPEIPHMSEGWLTAVLAGTTVALLTYDEAQMIVPEPLPPEAMAARIRQMGPELVILKLGAKGMIGHTASETRYEPGLVVPVVDLTGAGDSVAAAVIKSYMEGYSLAYMLRLANATGAACVQKFGAGVNVPTWEEITAVLAQVNH